MSLNDNYVSVNIVGGIGNQLFEVFAAIAYALEYNMGYKFSLCVYTNRPANWNTIFKYLSHVMIPNNNHLPELREKEYRYNKLPIPNGRSIRLSGYFQSPMYFDKYYDQIMDILHIHEIRHEIKSEYSELFNTSNEIISLHFRLGDYKHCQQGYPILPIDYYRNALAKFPHDRPYRVLYLCEAEDNIVVEKSIDILRKEYPAFEFIKVPDSVPDWKQLLVMSLCNHNIIANSTFSWWGAYLGDNKEHRRVLYPSIWYGPAMKHLSVEDLFPSTWHRIPF